MSYSKEKVGKCDVIYYDDGEVTWHYKSMWHNENGPAYERGEFFDDEYFLNDEPYTKEGWEKEMRKRKLEKLGI